MGVKTIGTGGDYPTIVAWEADIGVGDATGPWIGQLLAQTHTTGVFSIAVTPATSAVEYIRLTAAPGAQHRGTATDTGLDPKAHAIWSKTGGIASLPVCQILEDFVEIDHIEMISGVTLSTGDFIRIPNGGVGATNFIKLHHLLIHHNGLSTNADNDGIVALDTDAIVEVYRNIIYGMGGAAINLGAITAAGSKIINNTMYACNRANSAGVTFLTQPGAAYEAYNNLGFVPQDGKVFPDAITSGGAKAGNGSDIVADPFEEKYEEFKNLTATDELMNATTTWTNTDCRLKATATMRNAGYKQAPPYVEGVRGNRVLGGWDVGADEYPTSVKSRVWAGGGATGERGSGRPWVNRPHTWRTWRVAAIGAIMGIVMAMGAWGSAGGCASPVSMPVRASVKGVDASRESKLDAQAGRDATQNDTLTLRILAASLGVCALAYPVGKCLWLLGARVRSFSGRDASRSPLAGSGSHDDGRTDAGVGGRDRDTRRTGFLRSPTRLI